VKRYFAVCDDLPDQLSTFTSMLLVKSCMVAQRATEGSVPSCRDTIVNNLRGSDYHEMFCWLAQNDFRGFCLQKAESATQTG
jgi:hypothetical protein